MSKVSRRKLLKMAAATAAAIPLESSGLIRLGASHPQVLVPADKGFSKEWLAQLALRGQPTRYRGDALQNIGMPIGGIGCGQVYLGGDGRLWHWDIFNQLSESDMGQIRNGLHYKEPMKPKSPFEMGFYASINAQSVPLDREHWPDSSFEGRYPMANIDYGVQQGVRIQLEASSPFIPLNAEDSSYPCAFMSFQATNTTNLPILVEMVGWMDNPSCLYSRNQRGLELTTQYLHGKDWTFFQHQAADQPRSQSPREEIIFADFESETYGDWKVEGSAFGSGPIEISKIPGYQGDVKGKGSRVVNSHHTRGGEDVAKGDAHTGKLTSPSFKISRDYITFLIGGGNHPGQTCINLIIDGKTARTSTGKNSNAMSSAMWDVRELQGQTAFIEIVDQVTGAWGNIGIDLIVFADKVERPPLIEEADFGTIGIGAVGEATAGATGTDSWPEFKKTLNVANAHAVSRNEAIRPGETKTFEFIVAWHFPNVNRSAMSNLQRHETFKRHYSTKFRDAREVFTHLAAKRFALQLTTKLWTNTWYDSTLPYWFLDRTMANTSTLSTSTCYRFDDGRFYAWEGVYCCPGTCTHVWHYAQAVGRLFPEIERDTRQRVDYGIAYHEDGLLGHRAEVWQDAATDGQCGTILRVYREHQMTSDREWLSQLWPKVKKSIEFLISQDPNRDGVLEGAQFNTLDATWYGKIAWISGLYVATLRAGEAMATEMGDADFAKLSSNIAEKGTELIRKDMFNGEYFVHRTDPQFPKAINTNDGCHIDQVFGQSWAFQVGLSRVLPEVETKSALKALFKHNFAPDVGTYRDKSKIKGGRWYALPGESGLLMCTWPKGGAEKASGEGNEDWAVGYFNECMTGFEHQVAGHMLWEGMVEEALIIEKTIHQRYDAKLRNPYNEIECSDHYARAMASYGVYLAACGYRYNGPQQILSFDPKIQPDNFRCAFTAAEGWGVFERKVAGLSMRVRLGVKHGKLALKQFGFRCPAAWSNVAITVEKGNFGFSDRVSANGMRWIDLDRSHVFRAGDEIVFKVEPK